jgi:3',5'-cyclic AMP phosphodiesterase CpdA
MGPESDPAVASDRSARLSRRHFIGGAAVATVAAAGAAWWAWGDDVRLRLENRIGGPSVGWPPEPFPADRPPSTRLAVAGDVGTGDERELRTAAVMSAMAAERPFDALLLLGDNVYPDGDPDRLGATVFEPFGPLLESGTELLAVLGNHDVRDGNGEPQADALGMPGRWYSHRAGDALVVALDSTQPDHPEQTAWLDRTLADGRDARWVVPILHHPPFAAGWNDSFLPVRREWVPLFAEHGVDLVLAGHDHDYQRIRPIDGVTYVVSGGAALTRPTDRADFTAVAWSTHHFTDIAVWDDRLLLRAVNQSGDVFDEVTLTPRSA